MRAEHSGRERGECNRASVRASVKQRCRAGAGGMGSHPYTISPRSPQPHLPPRPTPFHSTSSSSASSTTFTPPYLLQARRHSVTARLAVVAQRRERSYGNINHLLRLSGGVGWGGVGWSGWWVERAKRGWREHGRRRRRSERWGWRLARGEGRRSQRVRPVPVLRSSARVGLSWVELGWVVYRSWVWVGCGVLYCCIVLS